MDSSLKRKFLLFLAAMVGCFILLGYAIRFSGYTPAPPAPASSTQLLIASAGNQGVIVWRDTEAITTGHKMFEAGIDKTAPDLLRPLIATQVIVSDGGMFASDVIVTEGGHQGCKGTVPNERLSK